MRRTARIGAMTVRASAGLAAAVVALAGCASGGLTKHPLHVSTAPGGSVVRTPVVGSASAQGSLLVDHYLSLVQARNVSGLRSLLAPGFRIRRPDGTRQGKAAYLSSLPAVSRFWVSHVTARSGVGVLAVSYDLRVLTNAGGTRRTVGPRAQFSVFAWQHNGWRLVSTRSARAGSHPR